MAGKNEENWRIKGSQEGGKKNAYRRSEVSEKPAARMIPEGGSQQ